MNFSSLPLVSIIINNYNYGAYLQQAIESALHQTYKKIEVIVVDDGSTDYSKDIILRYATQIKFFFQSNQGQNSACNLGFLESKGDFIHFLDSDDFLDYSCVENVVKCFTNPEIIKAQFYLKRVDSSGKSISGFSPTLRMPENREIARHMESYGFYPAPPMSGNVYKRSFIKNFFPMPVFHEQKGDFYCPIDGLLSGVAGFFPYKIKVFNEVYGYYRVHGKNKSDAASVNNISKLRRMFMRDWIREKYQNNFAYSIGKYPQDDLSRFSPMICKQRLLSIRLDKKNHPIPNDSRIKLLLSGLCGSLKNPYMHFLKRFFSFFGFIFLAAAPRFVLSHYSQLINKSRTSDIIK